MLCALMSMYSMYKYVSKLVLMGDENGISEYDNNQ